MTFLLVCFGAFVLATGGIIYLHATGQAKWAPNDKAEVVGWIASVVQQSVFFLPILLAYWFLFSQMSVFIPSSWPKEFSLFLFIGGFICLFCAIQKVEEGILQRWRFWKYLSRLGKRGEHVGKKRNQRTKNRIRDYFRRS